MSPKALRINGFCKETNLTPSGAIGSLVTSNLELKNELVTIRVPSSKGDRKNPRPFAYTIDRSSYLQGKWTRKGLDGWTYIREGNLRGSIGIIPQYSDLSAGRSLVYNKCLSKLHEQLRGSIDLSIDILQFRQTAQMVKSTLTPAGLLRFAKSLSDIRRPNAQGLSLALDRRIKPADFEKHFNQMSPTKQLEYTLKLKKLTKGDAEAWRKYFTVPADKWLEWRYGWLPLGQSIYDSLDVMARAALAEAEEKLSERVTIPYPVTDKRYLNNAPLDATIKGKTSCTIRAIIKTTQDPKNLGTWGSLNPASIAWELMPYSFVVDWFINVADYLRSLETALMYSNSIEKICVTELDVYDVSVQCNGTYTLTSNGGKAYAAALNGHRHYCTFDRTVPASTALLPRVPQFRAELGSKRLASAAALLAQFLKR